MDDPQIHGTIEALVAEEHELWQRESAGAASEAGRERLRGLRVSHGRERARRRSGSRGWLEAARRGKQWACRTRSSSAFSRTE